MSENPPTIKEMPIEVAEVIKSSARPRVEQVVTGSPAQQIHADGWNDWSDLQPPHRDR